MAIANILKLQPFKGLYVTISLLGLLFVRIPWWTLRNLIPAWRPRRSWALRRCLLVNLTRHLYVLGGRVGGLLHNPTYKEMEGGEGVNGVWIDAVPELVTGQLKHWANVAGVEGARIPGYWCHKSDEDIKTGKPAKAGEKVVLSLRGSAYDFEAFSIPSIADSTQNLKAYRAPALRGVLVTVDLRGQDVLFFPLRFLDASSDSDNAIRARIFFHMRVNNNRRRSRQ